ncbi:MAG: hypothetical protein KAI72_08460 [Candidatus Pacebacteria bacterium]|nr:hypothetical protein [Candidatus Paceibacterota bacterium]
MVKTQALFYSYVNFILSIKREFLDQFEEVAGREIKIQRMSFCNSFPELDYNNLSYLLESKSPDLYAEIHNVYRKCLSVVDSINDRNQQYMKLTAGVMGTNPNGSAKVKASVIDINFLKDYTDILYREVTQCLKKINAVDEKIEKYIKSNFKGRHALCMEKKLEKNEEMKIVLPKAQEITENSLDILENKSNKMEYILRYLENQYETGKEMFQSIDSRIGNYLIITGLFWGVSLQVVPSIIKYLKSNFEWNYSLLVTIAVSCILSNIFLLSSILMMLYLFTKMGYAIPGIKKSEDYSKVINNSSVTDKDVLISIIGNYSKAINANLLNSNDRGHYFRELRKLMFCGIIFTVICMVLFGTVNLTMKN